MKHEFKKITNKNETRYVLETMTAGATGASSIATAPGNLGELHKRLQELKDKLSVPTTKPRNPAGMGSTPGRGTQVHKDKKHDQKMGKEKHKKPFYEQIMDEIEQISELEKPSGSMFLKFRGKRLPGDEMMVLGYGGFGTTPKDVTTGNALIKPFPADEPYDVINKIEKIFKDQDFVGIEKIILDIPNALTGQLRDVLDYAEQDPERFELYTGDDGEEPEAKTGGKVIGIGPDGKRIDRTPPKAQVGGSSRGVKQSKPDVTLSPKTPQAQTLLKQSGLPRTGSGYKAPHALLQKLQSSLGQSKFDSMFNVGGMAEGDEPDHEISMASSELTSIAADAANLLDIVKQRSEEEGLEAWQQSKITKAADFMNSVLQSIRGDEEQGVAEGSGPQAGDEVYYGNRLVGWFKGYSKYGKIITEPNVDEMGDEYLSKDAYWDPQPKITIKPKQGVAEGGILKSIKRGLQGWDKNAVGPGGEKLGDPRDIVKRAKAMDTDTARKVRSGLDAASDHSPAGLQKRVLDRKLKGVAEGYGELDNLKAKFEERVASIIARAKAEGRPLTDREKKAIAILKGKDQSVAEDRDPEDERISQQRAQANAMVQKQHAAHTATTQAPYEKMSDEDLQDLAASIENQIDQIARQSHGGDYRPGSPLRQASNKAQELSSKLSTIRRVLDKRGMTEGMDSLTFWKREAQKARGAANIDWYAIGVEHGKQGIVMNPPYGVGGKAVKLYSKGLDAGQQGMAEGSKENKNWRDEARKASGPWSPTNLPNYKKSKEQGVGEAHGNSKIYDKCWTGFRKVPGKKRGEDDSCTKIKKEDAYINHLMAALESKK